MKFLLFSLFFVFSLNGIEPVALYLMIQKKPATHMTVCWVLPEDSQQQVLKYRAADKEQWFQVEVSPQKFPEKLPYSLYTVELNKLSPDTRYEFVLADEKKIYAFKTLPSTLDRPVKFVAGGDIYHDEIATVENMNKIAANQDPDFALLGGDIAYSGSKFIFFKEEGERWIQFLKSWSKTMFRKDGALIPIIACIGNHDVNGRYDQDPSRAFFYRFLFPSQSATTFHLIFDDKALQDALHAFHQRHKVLYQGFLNHSDQDIPEELPKCPL